MLNFFHNLGVGIISAFIAFTVSFHSQPTPAVSTPTASIITATTTSTSEKSNNVFTPYQRPNNKPITTPTIKTPSVASPDTIAFDSKPLVAPTANFYNSLSALYADKISYINHRIGLGAVNNLIIKSKEDEAKSFVSDSQKLQAQYSWANTTASNTVAINHINFLNYEIEQIDKLYPIMENRITELKQIKSRLESETLVLQPNISEAEYRLRAGELGDLVNEANIEKIDTSVFNSLDNLFQVDKQYDDLELKAAYEQKAQADADLASIKIQQANIVPIIPISSMITPTQTQPTSIHCETTQNSSTGNPSILCTEFPTMKSMRCDTTYNTYGNAENSCYFQ